MAAIHGNRPFHFSTKRSSGYLAKSLIRSIGISSYLSQRIQPTWLHQKPRSGEWMSSSVSL